jgi:hypothetical protein
MGDNMPNYKSEETKQNSLKNLKPFRGYSDDMTEEERERVKEIAVKGGKATQECLKKARSFKDVCNQALTTKVSREKAVSFVGDDIDLIPFDENGFTDMQTVLSVRALRISADGNAKYLEFIRDTSGQKPKDEMSITADIMTDSDRALIENINKRLNGDG